MTQSEREQNLRRSIERYIRRYVFRHELNFREVNGELIGIFGKKRDDMTLKELQQVWKFVQEKYPTDGI